MFRTKWNNSFMSRMMPTCILERRPGCLRARHGVSSDLNDLRMAWNVKHPCQSHCEACGSTLFLIWIVLKLANLNWLSKVKRILKHFDPAMNFSLNKYVKFDKFWLRVLCRPSAIFHQQLFSFFSLLLISYYYVCFTWGLRCSLVRPF